MSNFDSETYFEMYRGCKFSGGLGWKVIGEKNYTSFIKVVKPPNVTDRLVLKHLKVVYRWLQSKPEVGYRQEKLRRSHLFLWMECRLAALKVKHRASLESIRWVAGKDK